MHIRTFHMDVLIKHRVRVALAAEALREGPSPWTITQISPSVTAFDARYVKPGDAIHVNAKKHKYHNRAGKYGSNLKGDMHAIELLPLNTMFGVVRGQVINCKPAQLKMYRRFNPLAMTIPLLRAYFNDDDQVLHYLRRCIECFGETEDSNKESTDASTLLRGIQNCLLHRRTVTYDPWNRHDFLLK